MPMNLSCDDGRYPQCCPPVSDISLFKIKTCLIVFLTPKPFTLLFRLLLHVKVVFSHLVSDLLHVKYMKPIRTGMKTLVSNGPRLLMKCVGLFCEVQHSRVNVWRGRGPLTTFPELPSPGGGSSAGSTD